MGKGKGGGKDTVAAGAPLEGMRCGAVRCGAGWWRCPGAVVVVGAGYTGLGTGAAATR